MTEQNTAGLDAVAGQVERPVRPSLSDRLASIWGELDPVDEWRPIIRDAASELSRLTAEAEALRVAPWIGECQACGHQHEAKRPQPLTDEQRTRLFIELNAPCVHADSPTAMFTIIVQAVERAHGIGA